MKYFSDDETEKRLAELEKKIREEYSKAYQEASASAAEYFQGFQARYKEQLEAYKGGAYTEEEFNAWVYSQVGRGERWNNLKSEMAERMSSANEIASAYINDTTPGIYSLNHNFEAYQISEAYPDAAFNIYDEQTIRQLMQGENHTEFRVTRTNPARDYEWNSKQIESALISGILQGKGPDKLADSFFTVMKRDRAAAIRNARTAVTSAQNSGRQQTYIEAEEMGIQLQKEWIATFDDRTRDTHGALDGERVGADESWVTFNGHKLRYPGDPEGEPSEVYNCRCTTRAVLKKINDKKRRTYSDWLEAQQAEEEARMSAQYNESTEAVLEDVKAQEHSKEELKELEEYGTERGIRVQNISQFDGESELLKSQIDALAKVKEEYKLKKVVLSFDKSLDNKTPASTWNGVVRYNPLVFRDRENTEKMLRENGYFAFDKMEGIAYHEAGHIITNTYGNIWLDVTQAAYYNINNKNMGGLNEARTFLKNNVSPYSVLDAYTEKGKLNTRPLTAGDFREVTSEILGKNEVNPTEFTTEYVKELKRRI